MKELDPKKVFVQYRDAVRPYEPVSNRKYTITHSDKSGELFVFIAENYAKDQITTMRDEVSISWEKNEKGFFLFGSVLVDGENVFIRNTIFYNEMPTALQALRQADRFLFENQPSLDNSQVFIKFISSTPFFNKIYNFGAIGNYK